MAACFKRRRHYHLFLQVKRPVSLGGETGLFLSLGLWIGEDNNRWQLFWVPDAACGCGGYSEACGGDCCECDCARRCVSRVRELAGGRICLLAAARVRLLGGAWRGIFAGRGRAGGLCRLGRLRRAGGRRCLGRFRYLGRGGLVCRGFCLFVCLAGVVIGRLRFFQIVEERISPGYELVGMGFILPCSKFTVINSSFLPFEAVAALAELRFARVFLRFCRHDLTAQLLNMLLNSCAGLLVAECFKCLV